MEKKTLDFGCLSAKVRRGGQALARGPGAGSRAKWRKRIPAATEGIECDRSNSAIEAINGPLDVGERLIASKPRRLQLDDIQQLRGLRDITADGLCQLLICFPAPVMTRLAGQECHHVLAWWRRVHPRESRP